MLSFLAIHFKGTSTMSLTRSITLTYQVAGPAEAVYAELYHFENFARLHPYMKKVSCVQQSSFFKEYWIEEELYLFGCIKSRPSYQARVSGERSKYRIRYTSQVKKNIGLCIDFRISSAKNGTVVVEERIELKTNALIAFVFFRILRGAHRQVFRDLQRLMRQEVQDLSVK